MSELDVLIAFAFGEFQRRDRIPPLAHEDVERFRASQGLSPGEFLDCFAKRVAYEYAADNLKFEVADAAMNSLYAYALQQYEVRLPSFAWEVFLAFDDGEFSHREDDAAVDPEAQYTRPAIQAIVARDRILS